MALAIVTGSSRGIGEATAIKLAEDGFDVLVNYSGNQERAEAVVAKIEALGQKAIAVKANVSDAEEVKEMIRIAIENFGSIDVVVNNAGITRDNLTMRMKAEDFDDVIATNLKGVFNVVQSVTRQMLKQRTGVIINMSSVVGSLGNAGQANYVASKAGVEGLTKTFAREFASRGVRVNAVAPGFIVSDMTDKLGADLVESMKQQIPLGSLGEVNDIAEAVSFLASNKAKYITGQTLHVNGGMFMN
ncbi:3-oxoacyl-[acyl-carrier-protein] reductase [Macrococcoides bohemicum]|uniref:3-oxoacyl-[acyl-carrier-protein] reductase n=1 Tax=Macrococcoides bohemicum TaxID=1903056 RepID=UPI00165D48EB|nr:3-oxoacyl-[acyl-carrier-protein] reductase [Macrococcus bohemicus]MBC9875113.1 3-oxoacyl-[acyl-carrier-protein] reductase [Macrococcus bohemicus]QRN49680.1 3-oxoacyl-[acyl-carrier-protein] reductase [Macrococcus bohemicus]QYA45801.1 3-oxoacyl-[acyl-carrier-protein] reductase [Macrococcus bohemicus]